MNEYERWSILLWMLAHINMKLEKIMTAQDDINAAVTAVTNVLTDVQGATATLLTDVQQLQQQIQAGQPVDTTALDSTVANIQSVQAGLDSAVSSVTNLATPPPPPTP